MRETINITRGTDVLLNDRLLFRGSTFDPSLSVNVEAHLVSRAGVRTSLGVEVVDDYLVISVPWVTGRVAGLYGLEVRGVTNGLRWATYADSLIRYTNSTVQGDASDVTQTADAYDITQQVSYRYGESPISEVRVEVDDSIGTPGASVSYLSRVLSLVFSGLKANGLVSLVQTAAGASDGGVNTWTATLADGTVATLTVRNGSRGNGIASVERVAESSEDGGVSTWRVTESDGRVTDISVRNGSRGNGIASVERVAESSEDGGVNTWRVTESDGRVTDISVHNGRTGKPGDSVIVGQGDLPLAHVLGEDNTKAISQKGVTDVIIESAIAIGQWSEPIPLDTLVQANCSLASGWYMATTGTYKNMQRHSVIPVTAGDKILLKNVSTETNDGHYAWLTSSYTGSYVNGDAIPFVTGEERNNLPVSDGMKFIIAPEGAAYLCINRVSGSGSNVLWEIRTPKVVHNLSGQVESLSTHTEEIDAMYERVDHALIQTAIAIGQWSGPIPLDTLALMNCSLGSSVWYMANTGTSKNKQRHSVIPVTPGDTILLKNISTDTSNGGGFYGWLTSDYTGSYTSQDIVPYVANEGRINLQVSDGMKLLTAPTGAAYLCINRVDGSGNTTLWEIRTPKVVHNLSGQVERLIQDVAETEQVFAPIEKIDITEITPQLCSLGTTTFYYQTSSGIAQHAQRHIAIPVTNGEIYRVKAIDGLGQVCVVTDAYDSITTFQNGVTIPMATGWTSRIRKDEVTFAIPSDGAYILLTIVDGSGLNITYEVEKGEMISLPAKDLHVGIPVKLRVVQWNIGGFSKGASSQSTYNQYPADYMADLPLWKQTINNMDADIICCCEYNIAMKTGENGEPDVLARDEIFSPFKHAYIRQKPSIDSYMMTAIFSHLAAKESGDITFAHSSSATRYYQTNKYIINNKDVYVIATHLDWNSTPNSATYRQQQMEELMTFAEDKEYVIICGDFNPGAGDVESDRIEGPEEFNQFLAAGFKMANHGYLGDFNTGNKTYSVLDNIITKGFDISNIKIYDGDNAANVSQIQEHQLSDHAAIGCTLTMLN